MSDTIYLPLRYRNTNEKKRRHEQIALEELIVRTDTTITPILQDLVCISFIVNIYILEHITNL